MNEVELSIRIDNIIKDFMEAMPIHAESSVKRDIEDCYKTILNKHLN